MILVLGLTIIPETRAHQVTRLDLPGVVLLSAGLQLIFVPVVEGRLLGWPVWLAGVVLVGAVLLVLFVRHQRRRDARDGSALLPMRLFRDRGFAAGVVTQGAFQAAMIAFTLVFVLYIQTFLGFDAFDAGLSLLPFSLGALVGTGIAVPLAARAGRTLVTLGAVIQAGAIGWVFALAIGSGQTLTTSELIVPLAAAGVGLGILVVPLADISLAGVDAADAGAASGALSTFQQLGAASGAAVSATVFFALLGTDPSAPDTVAALTGSAIVAVSAYLLAAIGSLLLPGRTAIRTHQNHAHAETDRAHPTEPIV